jgi:hypothetical protein
MRDLLAWALLSAPLVGMFPTVGKAEWQVFRRSEKQSGKFSDALQQAERVLFDFEKPEEIACWSPLELPEAPEPAARVEGASGALKITFAGGAWPAIRTTAIPSEDWAAWHTFRAEVTVERTCLAGFRILQEKSTRKRGYDEGVTRWEKTAFLAPDGDSHDYMRAWSREAPDVRNRPAVLVVYE